MTVTVAADGARAVFGADADALWGRIPAEFLQELGWQAQDHTLTIPRDHRVLGWRRVRANAAPHRAASRRRVADRDEYVIQLGALPPLLVAQLLCGLHDRYWRGLRTDWSLLVRLCHRAIELGIGSIEQMPLERDYDHLTAGIQTAVRRTFLHPDTERVKDIWDMAVFGLGGYLDFTGISQPWLREAVKLWAFDYLPTRRGTGITSIVKARILALARLSDSLRLQRDDSGTDFTRLAATDITAFCNRMAFLEGAGEVTARLRLSTCRMVKTVLDGFRVLGLTRPGQCLAGLPDDFALRRAHIPDETDDDEAGKDVPAEVMRVMCDGLALLAELRGPEARTAIELLIDTGRRPIEICQLRLDCLEHDGDGQPVLVYDSSKSRRLGRRLPIATATAEVIAAQQARVRVRFPHTPTSELKLIPATQANPHGRRGLSTTTLRNWHRLWLARLPTVTVATETTVEGRAVAALLPYDMLATTIYAYRHSYAQRHADAGVPVDVLRELMGHKRMDTTQRYYNVGAERRREAIERVAQVQFDRHGARIWRDAKALLDDERVRLAVGEVAVPYGGCSEPSNVSAGGDACPIRFRCVGCGHFRTDASYLPDLEAYLADLLRNRERILAASVDADEWACAEALPSTEEISRVRRLVDRIRAELDDLTPQDRAEIEHAVAIVRRGRILLRVTPARQQSVRDLRPERVS